MTVWDTRTLLWSNRKETVAHTEPAYLHFLPQSSSHSAQIILHVKKWSLPPSKLWLLHSSEDQQKNSSSFANMSWYQCDRSLSLGLKHTRVISVKLQKPTDSQQFCHYSADSLAPSDYNSVRSGVFGVSVLIKLTGNQPKIL